MTARLSFSVPVLAALALAGCTSPGPFPSLAMRPGEGDITLAEPMHPIPIVPNDPAIGQRIVTLRAQAATGQQAFETAYPVTAAAAARAGATGSDSWVGAQEALSRLEAARGDTSAALAALVQLSSDRADEATSPADFAAIQAAIGDVETIVRGQETRLTALRGRLGTAS